MLDLITFVNWIWLSDTSLLLFIRHNKKHIKTYSLNSIKSYQPFNKVIIFGGGKNMNKYEKKLEKGVECTKHTVPKKETPIAWV